jgi:hypothetical protein
MFTFTPTTCALHFANRNASASGYFSIPQVAVVESIRISAGAAIGTAVVSYPSRYAKDISYRMGSSVRISIGGSTVFRGIIGDVPAEISVETDQHRLMLFCDKRLLERTTIGQPDVASLAADGSTRYGFRDVGFDMTFNPAGIGNKNAEGLIFSFGTAAVPWTLRTIMEFLFHWYGALDEVRCDAVLLSSAWNHAPSGLCLTGQTLLQAVDRLATLAGESWALSYGVEYSSFVTVCPGVGRIRPVSMAAPKMGGTVQNANVLSPISVRPSLNVSRCVDCVQVVSARTLIEHTYYSGGTNPLLVKLESFVDPKYSYRYITDVGAYEDHGLGKNRTAGSAPKPWHKTLLTRRTKEGNAYVTAAQITLDKYKAAFDPLPEPFLWVSNTGLTADAKLVLGGYQINHDAAYLDVESVVDVAGETNGKTTALTITPETVRFWLTVVTELEFPSSYRTEEASGYLPQRFNLLIEQRALVPEQRYRVTLPALGTDPNGVVFLAADSVERYVNVSTQLVEIAGNALRESSRVERSVELEFPFFPVVSIGERIRILGRSVPLDGTEVVVDVQYDVDRSYTTMVRATNIVAGVRA